MGERQALQVLQKSDGGDGGVGAGSVCGGKEVEICGFVVIANDRESLRGKGACDLGRGIGVYDLPFCCCGVEMGSRKVLSLESLR